MYNNYIDRKEWYGKVDCKNLSQVRDFCERRGYSKDYYILVDFSIPSGKKRFFIYDLQRGKRVMSSYCMHGSGKGNTDAKPKFSNELGSGCSSLGRYVMVGKGRKFKNSVRLRGLDKSNLGFSYRPGDACVVSTYRLKRKNDLWKVAIHEFLHSRGLPHCKKDDVKCLMQDAHGKNPHLQMKNGLCEDCKKAMGK